MSTYYEDSQFLDLLTEYVHYSETSNGVELVFSSSMSEENRDTFKELLSSLCYHNQKNKEPENKIEFPWRGLYECPLEMQIWIVRREIRIDPDFYRTPEFKEWAVPIAREILEDDTTEEE